MTPFTGENCNSPQTSMIRQKFSELTFSSYLFGQPMLFQCSQIGTDMNILPGEHFKKFMHFPSSVPQCLKLCKCFWLLWQPLSRKQTSVIFSVHRALDKDHLHTKAHEHWVANNREATHPSFAPYVYLRNIALRIELSCPRPRLGKTNQAQGRVDPRAWLFCN